jgi:aryl-alcohol dehydrogenase-like predicted oxidoreductase
MLNASIIALGCGGFGGRLDRQQSTRIVRHALDRGITLYDTADVYAEGLSESYLASALGQDRSRVVIATKVGAPWKSEPAKRGATRSYINKALHDSLRRLKTDYIDLYYVHFPDPETPIEETLRALEDAIITGKVRYIGFSNFPPEQLTQACVAAKTLGIASLVAGQYAYNLIARDVEGGVVQVCQASGLGLVPYHPLARGFLSGKYHPNRTPTGSRLAVDQLAAAAILTEANFSRLANLAGFAKATGYTVLDLAIAWLVARTFVSSIIVGVSKPNQIDDNLRAAAVTLSESELLALDSI